MTGLFVVVTFLSNYINDTTSCNENGNVESVTMIVSPSSIRLLSFFSRFGLVDLSRIGGA